MTCQLCSGPSKGDFCDRCEAQLAAGLHPIICLACHKVDGPSALRWFPTTDLTESLMSTLGEYRDMGVTVFITTTCEHAGCGKAITFDFTTTNQEYAS